MIKSFSDHSANERTFLAWVRTSVAIMAFGFLLERFDLFLQIAAASLGQNTRYHLPGTGFGREAGLAVVLLGVAMTIIAAIRFMKTGRYIESPEQHPGSGARLDITLALLLAILGVALAFYLTHAIVARA